MDPFRHHNFNSYAIIFFKNSLSYLEFCETANLYNNHSYSPFLYSFLYETKAIFDDAKGKIFSLKNLDSELDIFCGEIFQGHSYPALPFFIKLGSFWTGNTDMPFNFNIKSRNK